MVISSNSCTRLRSAVGSVSGNRCESDCRSRGRETTMGGNGIWAKRLGYGGETTRVENRGETTRGETTRGKRLGGETSCYRSNDTVPFLFHCSLWQKRNSSAKTWENGSAIHDGTVMQKRNIMAMEVSKGAKIRNRYN